MKRFHVLAGNGRLVSGAIAFVDVWRRLPRWRWAARVASLPGAMTILEFGCRLCSACPADRFAAAEFSVFKYYDQQRSALCQNKL